MEYRKKPLKYEGGWGDVYRYEYFTNGTVKYYECLHLTLSDNACQKGSSVWNGKYSTKENIITMKNFKEDENDSYKPSNMLTGPKDQVIVYFDNIYLCDRQEGLDCNKKFKKIVD